MKFFPNYHMHVYIDVTVCITVHTALPYVVETVYHPQQMWRTTLTQVGSRSQLAAQWAVCSVCCFAFAMTHVLKQRRDFMWRLSEIPARSR